MAKDCVLAPEAALRLLNRHMAALRAPLAALREEDADAVHDVRVASRRLRAVLAEHRKTLDPELCGQFTESLRAVTRGLGVARELDVSLGILEKLRPQVHGAARYALIYAVRVLRQKRRGESAAVQACAAQIDSAAFLELLVAVCRGMGPQKACYVKRAPRRLRKRLDRVRRLYRLWESVPCEPILHRVRVAFKKLRYACELYEPLYPPGMQGFIKECKAAQEALGNWNDYRVLRDYVVALAAEAPPRASEGAAGLFDVIEGRMGEELGSFPEKARAFFTPERVAETEALFRKPEMACCRSKSLDAKGLDALY